MDGRTDVGRMASDHNSSLNTPCSGELKNNTTMKFHEILTTAKSDISKIWNFTRKPLFQRQSVVKELNQILIRIGILQESPFSMTDCQIEKHIDKK